MTISQKPRRGHEYSQPQHNYCKASIRFKPPSIDQSISSLPWIILHNTYLLPTVNSIIIIIARSLAYPIRSIDLRVSQSGRRGCLALWDEYKKVCMPNVYIRRVRFYCASMLLYWSQVMVVGLIDCFAYIYIAIGHTTIT